jgi:hypothetical protein
MEYVKVRLVWKRAYKERLIPDKKTFPPKEILEEIETGRATELGKMFLLKTLREYVAKRQGLVFLEGDSVIRMREFGYRWIDISNNGKFIGLGGFNKISDEILAKSDSVIVLNHPFRFTLMNIQGEVLWLRKESLNPLLILDNGEVIVQSESFKDETGLEQRRGLTIYSPEGEIVFNLGGEDVKNLVHYADENKKPVFVFWEDYLLWLFTEGGKVVWRKEIKDLYGWDVFLSGNGQYIFLSGWVGGYKKSGGWIGGTNIQRLFDNKGKLIREYSFIRPALKWRYTRRIFSSEGDYFVIRDVGSPKGKNTLYFIECSSGRILWDFVTKREKEIFQDVQISTNGDIVLLQSLVLFDPVYGKLNEAGLSFRFRVFNRTGQLLLEDNFPMYETVYEGISMADDGSYFFVRINKTLYCYAIDR